MPTIMTNTSMLIEHYRGKPELEGKANLEMANCSQCKCMTGTSGTVFIATCLACHQNNSTKALEQSCSTKLNQVTSSTSLILCPSTAGLPTKVTCSIYAAFRWMSQNNIHKNITVLFPKTKIFYFWSDGKYSKSKQ